MRIVEQFVIHVLVKNRDILEKHRDFQVNNRDFMIVQRLVEFIDPFAELFVEFKSIIPPVLSRTGVDDVLVEVQNVHVIIEQHHQKRVHVVKSQYPPRWVRHLRAGLSCRGTTGKSSKLFVF